MSTTNPNLGVGGTAKDGGLSTAATVADGGPDDQQTADDSAYAPGARGGKTEKPVTRSQDDSKEGYNLRNNSGGDGGENVGVIGDYSGEPSGAKPSNEIYGVGGTDNEGDVSTAATVADGGPDKQGDDEEYKPE